MKVEILHLENGIGSSRMVGNLIDIVHFQSLYGHIFGKSDFEFSISFHRTQVKLYTNI